MRILRYLRPHAATLVASTVATFLFALLDAFSFVLIIPFLHALFGTPGAAASVGAGAGRLAGVLDATLGRWIDTRGDPLAAVQGIILFILIVLLLKNAIDFAR